MAHGRHPPIHGAKGAEESEGGSDNETDIEDDHLNDQEDEENKAVGDNEEGESYRRAEVIDGTASSNSGFSSSSEESILEEGKWEWSRLQWIIGG